MSATSRPVHTVVVDWDGTAVPHKWPDRPTEFMPGFVENMRRIHEAGMRIVIFSARLNPHDPYTGQRSARWETEAAANFQYIRSTLDAAGLSFIAIWAKEGKPSGAVYVDDKAERYNGCAKCWDKVTDRILVRLGKEEAVFPAFEMEGR